MRLVAFTVKNYRSITAAYKLPIRQTTILVGPNNEGKSNILRALAASLEILQALGGRRILRGRLLQSLNISNAYNWSSDYPISLQGKSPEGKSIFELEFKLDKNEIQEFFNEVKSKLNGTLPIRLSVGDRSIGFHVIKKGPGGSTLSSKADAIANFVATRVDVNYIPAVRTAEAAEEVVNRMVQRELAAIETDPAYQKALAQVAALQQPLLTRLSGRIRDTLREFLPNVKQVDVRIPREARYRALRHACEIIVDDGTPTHLARKGDGVQSLAALSLLRHASTGPQGKSRPILAIEEPESHLHPMAIHQLRSVLAEITKSNQLIMATHCPLFVDRASVGSNIIVRDRRAIPAKHVREIRDVLGVRASDNLQNAELMLLVEGECDRRALKAIFAACSKRLNAAMGNGSLGVESLHGSGNLSYKASQVRESLCSVHCFLDHDAAGLQSFKRAKLDGLMTDVDVHFSIAPGKKESELEDLYNIKLYDKLMLNGYGVSLDRAEFKGQAKWSERLKATFKSQGKTWNDALEREVKEKVAELVVGDAGNALNPHTAASVTALVSALETKLSAAHVAAAA